LIDALLPPRCLACGTGLGGEGALCAPCWSEIEFIDGPACAICGLPFEFDQGPGALCGGCLQQPPAYRRHRSVMRYGAASRSLILGFKHGDRTEGAPTFGGWLRRVGADFVRDGTLIAPVSLHRRRLFTRRFNQSALLAKSLAAACRAAPEGAPKAILTPGLLRRTRHTASQGNLSRAARRRNVAGAFRVHPGFAARLENAHVLLIDDVMTTGATIEACANVLLRAGAGSVDVLTLARVVRSA
jgi:ComF family protein